MGMMTLSAALMKFAAEASAIVLDVLVNWTVILNVWSPVPLMLILTQTAIGFWKTSGNVRSWCNETEKTIRQAIGTDAQTAQFSKGQIRFHLVSAVKQIPFNKWSAVGHWKLDSTASGFVRILRTSTTQMESTDTEYFGRSRIKNGNHRHFFFDFQTSQGNVLCSHGCTLSRSWFHRNHAPAGCTYPTRRYSNKHWIKNPLISHYFIPLSWENRTQFV